ncbi:cell division suppressor protein YneA [Heyndrickxia vini]|uniref:LysM peptidoglycan-binding domain-containing protein n=1 Tax=Heyndrickxia vini TaxID=1476025 RepID=A0ABX7DZ80_9BACI|nr:LysM peptidoglycan-binding domain-containing protein [Heyndrickxia vini]QQZ07842.1 LysM peptidoglycan-binding domain-containing protein [Heyndrickxia vini]
MTILWKKYSYVIILIVLSMVIGLYAMNSFIDDKNYQEVIVTKGQSLWEIAHIYSKEHSMNPNEFIEWVTKKNHLTSSNIKAGEKIIIPIKTKKQLDDSNQYALDLE